MYKVHCGISLEILLDLFLLRQAKQYSLRNRSQFIIPNMKTVNHCLENLKYLGPTTWETVPSHLKEIGSLKKIKHVIKKMETRIVSMSVMQIMY